MPTTTFFRLPEEKRQRLMEASWRELTQARFAEISINRIITAARIPRGSFYQYFTDKEDLIRYLLEDMRIYFINMLRDILIKAEGDLFILPLMAYDQFMDRQGGTDAMLDWFIKILKLNQGIDVQSFMGGPMDFLPDPLWKATDPSKLRRSDREYADQVFHMSCAVLAYAVAETLCKPDERARLRELMKLRIDLLRYGGAAEGYKEVTA